MKKELFHFYGTGNIDSENGAAKAPIITHTALGGGIGDKPSSNATLSNTASNTTNKSVEIDYTTTIDVKEEDNNTTLKDVEEDKNSMKANQGTKTINGQNTKPDDVTDDSGYVDDTKIPVSAAGIK